MKVHPERKKKKKESSPRKPSRHVADNMCPPTPGGPPVPILPKVPSGSLSAPRTHLLRPRQGTSGQGPRVLEKYPEGS